jgi:hypothetical protein
MELNEMKYYISKLEDAVKSQRPAGAEIFPGDIQISYLSDGFCVTCNMCYRVGARYRREILERGATVKDAVNNMLRALGARDCI